MAEAAYADLETPGQVLNEDGEDTDRNTPRWSEGLAHSSVFDARPGSSGSMSAGRARPRRLMPTSLPAEAQPLNIRLLPRLSGCLTQGVEILPGWLGRGSERR
jgi:hypothetical protein